MESTPKEEKKETQSKQKIADIFDGIDEDMELDTDQQKALNEFETVNKEGKDVEFDKVRVEDLGFKVEHRRIPVPRHRFTPLKTNWDSILKTLVEYMKL